LDGERGVWDGIGIVGKCFDDAQAIFNVDV
jgi:hypothetical protein